MVELVGRVGRQSQWWSRVGRRRMDVRRRDCRMEEMMKQVERRDKQVEEQSESVSIDHLEDNSIMFLTFLHWNRAAIRRSKRKEDVIVSNNGMERISPQSQWFETKPRTQRVHVVIPNKQMTYQDPPPL